MRKSSPNPPKDKEGDWIALGENWGVLRDGKSSASSLLDGTTLLEICGLPVWKRKRGTDGTGGRRMHKDGSRVGFAPLLFLFWIFLSFSQTVLPFLPFPRFSSRPANPRDSSSRPKKQRAIICFENLALFLVTSRLMHCISGETGLRACLFVFNVSLFLSRALSNHISIRVGSTLMTPVARFIVWLHPGGGNSSSYHLSSSYHQTHISYSGV
ncbi:hypothetical protein GQ607_015517 [Colletotrichum asianum]|uniref:Uncharacterized protein n=1 Tax=Colletotrichum asianum TaxID=702518 RepID=A0A8H3ZKR1_9PEZI|nr:hypothetical protein GQ607_015517 [Colletotrichum asianum]